MKRELTEYEDPELVEILANQSDYQSWLVEAVRVEAEKRNIDMPRLSEQIKTDSDNKNSEPLAFPLKMLFFAFPIGVLQWIFAHRFEELGYKRKAKECWYSMFFGIAFYFLMFKILTNTHFLSD